MVEFNAIENNSILTFSDKPFLIKDVNSAIVHNFFNNVVQAYEASVPSALAIKTSTYNLISHICKEKTQKYQKRFNAISPGIELLESDPLCKLSIDEIAQSCNVSTCYFRRLFKEYSGKTPLEYQMDLRLNMSKSLLESGEATLEYIAETLNFTSSSYFCRLFKKNLVLPQVNTKSVSIYQNSLNYQYRKPRLRKLLFNFYDLNRHLIGYRRLFFKIIFSNSNSNYRIFFKIAFYQSYWSSPKILFHF